MKENSMNYRLTRSKTGKIICSACKKNIKNQK